MYKFLTSILLLATAGLVGCASAPAQRSEGNDPAQMGETRVATTYVAVVETESSQGGLSRDEKNFVTDRLRERAKKSLPEYLGFVIMTRENIEAMLPPGKSIEECEGNCLVETGRNINANYIAQARVGKVGAKLSLTVELYETKTNNLVSDFTAREKTVDDLLDAIDRDADAMFSHIVQKGSSLVAIGDDEGFSDVSMGGAGYQASGARSIIADISSNPAGALVSIDGAPNSSCSKTPCSVQLKEGSHRFAFGLDMYFNRDTTFNLTQKNNRLQVYLLSNFGELDILPRLVSGVGNAMELNVTVDGNRVSTGKMRLAPGSHSVEISHKCYEKVQFTVKIKNGSDLKFEKKMQPLMGGLDLSAMEDGKPKSLPVYVNGEKEGKTPFLESIPVCSKVTIGQKKEKIAVTIKAGATVSYVHKVGGNIPSVKIGKQIWMKKNLNIKTAYSWCYDNKPENCEKYGRLYAWYAAMKACPAGWHYPSADEWKQLFKITTNLKSKSGWDDGGNGDDPYGFSVLPAGSGADSRFGGLGSFACFWRKSEPNDHDAYYWPFTYYNKSLINEMEYAGKGKGCSVRCIKNSDDGE